VIEALERSSHLPSEGVREHSFPQFVASAVGAQIAFIDVKSGHLQALKDDKTRRAALFKRFFPRLVADVIRDIDREALDLCSWAVQAGALFFVSGALLAFGRLVDEAQTAEIAQLRCARRTISFNDRGGGVDCLAIGSSDSRYLINALSGRLLMP
jgi:hypothetical protein